MDCLIMTAVIITLVIVNMLQMLQLNKVCCMYVMYVLYIWFFAWAKNQDLQLGCEVFVDVMFANLYSILESHFNNMPTSEADVSLYQCSRKVLEERLCPCVNNAVVFLDNSAAEVIHWHGGASILFDYGALDVREFSSFEVQLHYYAWCMWIFFLQMCTLRVPRKF